MKKRDLSREQYEYRMHKLGFTTDGFLGYWRLPGMTIMVSDLNAGDNRRAKLRYMLRAWRREQAKAEAKKQGGAS